MCEANAYVVRGGEEVLILDNVDLLEPSDGKIRLLSLFGEEKFITGRIKSVSLVDHKIIIEET